MLKCDTSKIKLQLTTFGFSGKTSRLPSAARVFSLTVTMAMSSSGLIPFAKGIFIVMSFFGCCPETYTCNHADLRLSWQVASCENQLIHVSEDAAVQKERQLNISCDNSLAWYFIFYNENTALWFPKPLNSLYVQYFRFPFKLIKLMLQYTYNVCVHFKFWYTIILWVFMFSTSFEFIICSIF